MASPIDVFRALLRLAKMPVPVVPFHDRKQPISFPRRFFAPGF